MARPWGLTVQSARNASSADEPITDAHIEKALDLGLDYLNVAEEDVDTWQPDMRRLFVNGAKYQAAIVAAGTGDLTQRPVGITSETATGVSVSYDNVTMTRIELAPMAQILWTRLRRRLSQTIRPESVLADDHDRQDYMRPLTLPNIPDLVSPQWIPADFEGRK